MVRPPTSYHMIEDMAAQSQVSLRIATGFQHKSTVCISLTAADEPTHLPLLSEYLLPKMMLECNERLSAAKIPTPHIEISPHFVSTR